MDIFWTHKAEDDIKRLYEFLAPYHPESAIKVVQSLVNAPNTLAKQPRIGEKLDAFPAREVRRLLVGQYEMRYEIKDNTLYILRIWHTREQRFS